MVNRVAIVVASAVGIVRAEVMCRGIGAGLHTHHSTWPVIFTSRAKMSP